MNESRAANESTEAAQAVGPFGDVAAVQRRTVAVLGAAQTVGSMGLTIGIATASLLALQISGSESEAGLTQTFQVLGTALASYLLFEPGFVQALVALGEQDAYARKDELLGFFGTGAA